jgi:hypothetical protein
MEQAGTKANYTGKILEDFIEGRLKERGYTYIDHKKFLPALYLGQAIYTRQLVIGKSIYGTDLKSDFVLFHPEKHPDCLAIEAKWQQSSGSVDEKYPFLVVNIQTKYPYKAIILLDGGGYKPQAKVWLKTQIGNNLLAVFSMSEFSKWANQKNL